MTTGYLDESVIGIIHKNLSDIWPSINQYKQGFIEALNIIGKQGYIKQADIKKARAAIAKSIVLAYEPEFVTSTTWERADKKAETIIKQLRSCKQIFTSDISTNNLPLVS